jgi:hypothetical protein
MPLFLFRVYPAYFIVARNFIFIQVHVQDELSSYCILESRGRKPSSFTSPEHLALISVPDSYGLPKVLPFLSPPENSLETSQIRFPFRI